MNITVEQKSTALHGILGTGIGIASGVMSKDPYQLPNLQILLLSLGVLFILYYVSQKLFKLREMSSEQMKYDAKWYLGNGAYPYIIFWIVTWILVYNI
ncbi:TPA: hypothetical protein H1012_03875 [archaeon]|nr:hypothetical protein [Candidatus Naiadarchaeales archaeon SRR2090159.bin1288]